MVKELLFKLCGTFSGSGAELGIANVIKAEMQNYSDEAWIDKNGNVICTLGKTPESARHILIDAHMDQVSMLVTAVDDSGFINISPCGGVDSRTLPGSTVFIHGKEVVTGIVCTTPPHLASKENSDFAKTEDLLVDTGLLTEKVHEVVSVGDYVSFSTKPQKLLGSRITAPALDNRAGVAVLIFCASLLKDKKIPARVTFLFSTREEINSVGAKTAAFALDYDETISVDVSFAKQPGVPEEKCGKLSGGPMIGIAPTLSRTISDKLIDLAKANKIPHQLEVMSSATSTTSDVITASKGGAAGGLLSVPLRNMHTPVEVVDVADIENTARLLVQYILTGGDDCGR